MWVVPTKEGRTVREIVAIWYRGATYQLGRGRNFYGIWPAGVPGAQPFERWPLTPEGWYGAWSRFAAIEAPGTIVPAAQHGTVTAGHPGAVPAGQRTAPAAGTDARSVPVTAPNPRIAPATGLDDRPAPGAAEDALSTPGAGLDDRPAPGAGTDARIGTGAGTDQWTAGTDSRTGAAATDKLAAGMGPQTAAAAGLYGGTAAGAALDQAAAPGAGFQPAAPAALTDDLRPAAGGVLDARTAPAAGLDEPAAPGAGLDERTPPNGGPAAEGGPDWRPAPFGGLEWRPAPPAGTDLPAPGARRDPRAVIAAVVVAVGVVTGIASLFPGYLGVSSLAQQPDLLVPHVLYLAGWSASALLILLGGVRLRIGALLGTGLSIVTFGFFLSDLGTVIADGSSLMGAGLVLGLIGWLACTAGSVMAFRLRAGGWLGSAGRPARPHGHAIESALVLTLAALGAAVAFVPAWDSYTLRTAAGATQTLTAGYAFSSPGAVIAGDVAVMVGLVAVVVAAALWRPVLLGAALLAGAVIPMAGQAISALIQVGQATSPTQFGISQAQAALAGLRITSGLTPAFWIYGAFVVVLAAMCVRMVVRSRPGRGAGAIPAPPAGMGVIPPATSTFS